MHLETKQIDRLNYFRSGLWIISVLCLIISSLGISFCSRSSDFYDARINYYDQLGNLLPKNDTIDEEIDSYYQGNSFVLKKIVSKRILRHRLSSVPVWFFQWIPISTTLYWSWFRLDEWNVDLQAVW